MSILAVLLTDTHLFEKRTKVDSIVDCNYDDVRKAFEKAIELAKENSLDRVIHAGDFFDSRKHQSQNLLKLAYSILEMFRKANIKLILVTGNHDKTDYRDSFSFMSVYKDHPNLQLVEDWVWYDDHENKIRYQFIAFFENDIYLEHLKDATLTVSSTYKNVLITHIGVHGVLKNDGEKDQSSITLKSFESFDKVLIGHYHNYSTHSNNKVVYIGSALQHNFGENNDKGVILLNNILHLQRVKTDFKEFKNIQVDVTDLKQSDLDDLVAMQNEYNTKVILTGDANLVKSFDKSKLLEAGIKVEVKTEVIKVQEVEQRVEKHSNESVLEHFTEFCSINTYLEEEGLIYLKPVYNV